MADPKDTQKNPKEELQTFVERNAEQREVLKERQIEHKLTRQREWTESEGRAKVNIKAEEMEEVQRKKDQREWKKKQDEQKRAIEADKKRKKEAEAHQKELSKKKEDERKQRLQYMKDLSNSNRLRMNVERRKRDSETTQLTLSQAADREFQITKEQANRQTHMDEIRIQKEAHDKRAKADIQENQQLEEARTDALKEQARLHEMEKSKTMQVESEFVRKQAVLSALPKPQRDMELRKLESEKRIAEDRIRKEFEKKKSDIEVNAQKQMLAAKKLGQKTRDDAAKEERKLISQKEHVKSDQIRMAGQEATVKHREAKKTAEEILHPMDKKIIELPGGLGPTG